MTTTRRPASLVVEFGDPAIRQALRSMLLGDHAHESDTALIEELGLRRGQVRIDMAVVNGLFHGYEIKSDRDSLRRLGHQIDVYGMVLDQATLVVGDRFLAEARHLVPGWWGIMHVRQGSDGLRFKRLRLSRRNPQRDPRVLVELLWADHAMALLEQRNIARGLRGKPRRIVWDRVCDHFTVDEIAEAVRGKLKARAASPVPA